MKTLLVLYVAISGAICFGQVRTSAGDPFADRLARVSKRFPPDLPAAKNRGAAKLSRPYCSSPGADAKSVSIKPCQAAPSRSWFAPKLHRP